MLWYSTPWTAPPFSNDPLWLTCNESKIYERFTFWNKLQEKMNLFCHFLRWTWISSTLSPGSLISVKRSNADWGVRSVAEVQTTDNRTELYRFIQQLEHDHLPTVLQPPAGHEGRSTQRCQRLAVHWILTGLYNLEGLVNTTTTNTSSCYTHTVNRIRAMHWPDTNFGKTLHACHKRQK